MRKPRVVVVGLGPAGADLLLPAARAALERVPIRFVRTARHPAVADLAAEGIALEPLDLLYDSADDIDAVYAAIADRVVETAREHGEIVYAVPGSPTVAERSVELVRVAGIDVELIPGCRSSTSRGGGSTSTRCTVPAWSTRVRSRSTPRARAARCCWRSATRSSCAPR